MTTQARKQNLSKGYEVFFKSGKAKAIVYLKKQTTDLNFISNAIANYEGFQGFAKNKSPKAYNGLLKFFTAK